MDQQDTTERVWLILEDEETLRDVMAAVLVMWGITPLIFADGNEAIDWLDQVEKGTAKQPLPELALLDIRLPRGPQGHDVAYRLRSLPETAEMPIAMITAFTFDEQTRAEIEEMARPDLFLHKPYPELDEFKEILESIIKK